MVLTQGNPPGVSFALPECVGRFGLPAGVGGAVLFNAARGRDLLYGVLDYYIHFNVFFFRCVLPLN